MDSRAIPDAGKGWRAEEDGGGGEGTGGKVGLGEKEGKGRECRRNDVGLFEVESGGVGVEGVEEREKDVIKEIRPI